MNKTLIHFDHEIKEQYNITACKCEKKGSKL